MNRLIQIIREEIDRSQNKLVDFDSFPPEVRKTYEDEYKQYPPDFSNIWNEKQREFRIDSDNPQGFENWYEGMKSEQFLKTLDDVIMKTIQDMTLLKRRNVAEMKLRAFEELIIPTLGIEGSDVVTHHLSIYEAQVLMNPYATAEEVAKGFREAKSIFDAEGNIDPLKIEKSEYFKGGEIKPAEFKRFIEKHPDFQGAYDHWKKLYDDDMKLTLTDLHAFRDSISFERIRDLRNFLIDYRKNKTNRLAEIIKEEIDKMSAIDLQSYYQQHANNKEWLSILQRFPEEFQREIVVERPEGSKEDIEELKNWKLTSPKPTTVNTRDALNVTLNKDKSFLSRIPQDVNDIINKNFGTNGRTEKVYDRAADRYIKYSQMPASTAKPSTMINGYVGWGVARFVAALIRGDKTINVWNVVTQ